MIYPSFLRFGKGNAKLDENVATFTLPAGVTCPGASICKCMAKVSAAGEATLVRGVNNEFVCYAASTECRCPNVRTMAWENFSMFMEPGNITEFLPLDDMVLTLTSSLATDVNVRIRDIIRVHVGGDFFCERYFQAWMLAAKMYPDKLFYAYTKSLPFWVDNMHLVPDNFILTASMGGLHDDLIKEHNLKHCRVFRTENDAKQAGYILEPKSTPDRFAMNHWPDKFGLILHGNSTKNKAGRSTPL